MFAGGTNSRREGNFAATVRTGLLPIVVVGLRIELGVEFGLEAAFLRLRHQGDDD